MHDDMVRSRSTTPEGLVGLCGKHLESSSDDGDNGKEKESSIIHSNILLHRSESSSPDVIIPLCGDVLLSSSEEGGSTPPKSSGKGGSLPPKYDRGDPDDEKQVWTDEE